MMPSECSSPWTSSMSCPGVRMVVEIGTPPIRISSGSSPATVSGREVNVPFWKRRIGVRTVTRLTAPACQPAAAAGRGGARPKEWNGLAPNHPDLENSDGIGALVTVRDGVVVHVERTGPGVVPVHSQRSRSIADGGLQQIVGDPGALVRLTNVDGVELPFGGCVAVPGRTGDRDADHLAVLLHQEVVRDSRFDLLPAAGGHPLQVELIESLGPPQFLVRLAPAGQMASRERVSVLGQRCTDSERGAHATTFRRSLWARPVVEAIMASTSDRLVSVQASARRTGAQQSVAPHAGRSQMRWG